MNTFYFTRVVEKTRGLLSTDPALAREGKERLRDRQTHRQTDRQRLDRETKAEQCAQCTPARPGSRGAHKHVHIDARTHARTHTRTRYTRSAGYFAAPGIGQTGGFTVGSPLC